MNFELGHTRSITFFVYTTVSQYTLKFLKKNKLITKLTFGGADLMPFVRPI